LTSTIVYESQCLLFIADGWPENDPIPDALFQI